MCVCVCVQTPKCKVCALEGITSCCHTGLGEGREGVNSPYSATTLDGHHETQDQDAAPAPLPDADLGRMMVRHFTSLVCAAPSLPVHERMQAQAHITLLHAALLSACPRCVWVRACGCAREGARVWACA